MSNLTPVIKNYRQVIGLWASPADLAADIGKNPEAVRKWKERNRIPSGDWADIVTAAQKRNYPVNAELLASIAKKKKRKAFNS